MILMDKIYVSRIIIKIFIKLYFGINTLRSCLKFSLLKSKSLVARVMANCKYLNFTQNESSLFSILFKICINASIKYQYELEVRPRPGVSIFELELNCSIISDRSLYFNSLILIPVLPLDVPTRNSESKVFR
jgi:hypothetical protein